MSFPQTFHVQGGELSDRQIQRLLARLENHLPYSIPLLRRIQFDQRRPKSTTARVYLVAAAPGAAEETTINDETGWIDSWFHGDLGASPVAPPWLAAHLDLSSSGQTQAWLYGSWEISFTTSPKPSAEKPLDTVYQSLTHHLFEYIYQKLVPEMPSEPGPQWLELKRTGKYLSVPYSRTKVLFGTISEALWPYFADSAITRTARPYLKYIFPSEKEGQATLPPHYRLSELREADLQMVCDRSPIPRTAQTLGECVSVGLLYDGQATPVGWGFLGKDASISSLHTEPEHRGNGLAVLLTQELLRRQGASVEDGEQRTTSWGHADVLESNTSSRRVMEKLGAQVMWRVAWIEIDLEKILR